jgi:hypothetical protein
VQNYGLLNLLISVKVYLLNRSGSVCYYHEWHKEKHKVMTAAKYLGASVRVYIGPTYVVVLLVSVIGGRLRVITFRTTNYTEKL